MLLIDMELAIPQSCWRTRTKIFHLKSILPRAWMHSTTHSIQMTQRLSSLMLWVFPKMTFKILLLPSAQKMWKSTRLSFCSIPLKTRHLKRLIWTASSFQTSPRYRLIQWCFPLSCSGTKPFSRISLIKTLLSLLKIQLQILPLPRAQTPLIKTTSLPR